MIYRRWVQAPVLYEFIHEPTNRRFAYTIGYLFAPSQESIMRLVRKNERLVVK